MDLYMKSLFLVTYPVTSRFGWQGFGKSIIVGMMESLLSLLTALHGHLTSSIKQAEKEWNG